MKRRKPVSFFVDSIGVFIYKTIASFKELTVLVSIRQIVVKKL